ncbi:hypothetical protein V866_007453 [Kwoniella sp. B9012]
MNTCSDVNSPFAALALGVPFEAHRTTTVRSQDIMDIPRNPPSLQLTSATSAHMRNSSSTDGNFPVSAKTNMSTSVNHFPSRPVTVDDSNLRLGISPLEAMSTAENSDDKMSSDQDTGNTSHNFPNGGSRTSNAQISPPNGWDDSSKAKKRKRDRDEDLDPAESSKRKVVGSNQSMITGRDSEELLRRSRAETWDISWFSNETQEMISNDMCLVIVRGHLQRLKTAPVSILQGCMVLLKPADFSCQMVNTALETVQAIVLAEGSVINDPTHFTSHRQHRSSMRIQLLPTTKSVQHAEADGFDCRRMDLLQFLQWFEQRSTVLHSTGVDSIDEDDLPDFVARPATQIQVIPSRPQEPRAAHNEQGITSEPSVVVSERSNLHRLSQLPGEVGNSHIQITPPITADFSAEAARSSDLYQHIVTLFKLARAKDINCNLLCASDRKRYDKAVGKGKEAGRELYNKLRVEWYETAFLQLRDLIGGNDALRGCAVYDSDGTGIRCFEGKQNIVSIVNSEGG